MGHLLKIILRFRSHRCGHSIASATP
jgi:hypothetical protein